jgi:hypothetical protein
MEVSPGRILPTPRPLRIAEDAEKMLPHMSVTLKSNTIGSG